MKLIDILVRELPDFGGWIKGHYQCAQDKNGEVCFYTKGKIHLARYGMWSIPAGSEATHDGESRVVTSLADDYAETIITREQYEAALAASKTEWDGEGLPPVGCDFLFGTHQTKAKCIAVGRDVIFASTGNPDEKDGFYEEFIISIHHSEFRPIRSEADKKRAECVIALSRIDPQAMPFEYGDKHSDGSLIGPFWYELYDAIAAGKIPHIRID